MHGKGFDNLFASNNLLLIFKKHEKNIKLYGCGNCNGNYFFIEQR